MITRLKIIFSITEGRISSCFVVSVFINNYRKAYNFNVNKGGHYAEV